MDLHGLVEVWGTLTLTLSRRTGEGTAIGCLKLPDIVMRPPRLVSIKNDVGNQRVAGFRALARPNAALKKAESGR